jgi:CRP-like cAMP-binding protein
MQIKLKTLRILMEIAAGAWNFPAIAAFRLAGFFDADQNRPAPRDDHFAVTGPPEKTQDFLTNLPLFGALSARELDRVSAGTTRVRAPAGSVLFRRGEPCSGFYIIVYGQVKLVFCSSDGAEKVVEILGPGQSFGEPFMFLDQPHVGFAETLADSLLLVIGKATLFAEIDRNPGFARHMLALLAERLHRMIADIETYTLKSGAQRVTGYLLRDVPSDTRSSLEVKLSAAKSVVASRLSITREHFSRLMHDLVRAGLIEVSGRTVRILDPARLRLWEG